MDEIKPTPGGQTIIGNSKEIAQLTSGDIQTIKGKFKNKRKIVYYCMLIFLTAGTLFSAYALYEYYGFSRFENLVPFIIGIVAVLICCLVLVAFKQEINQEFKSNKKWIYRGVVSKRSEKSTHVGVGKNRDVYYSNFIYLGDEIIFENKELYYEVNIGDTIDVQISEKLKIVLYKKIEKAKSVKDALPEVIADYGIAQEIRHKQEQKSRVEFLNDDEIAALQALKKRRIRRILITGVIITLLMGATAELNLYIDSYNLEETIQLRLGFWGIPLAFFSLLYYRRTVPLAIEIKSGEKVIIIEKLTNKDEWYSDAAKAYTYTLKGIREKIEVSKEIFNSISPGDDFEIHKTKIRNAFLVLVILKNGAKYFNPKIFKTK